jgi:transcriptional regulator of NAD metabolism
MNELERNRRMSTCDIPTEEGCRLADKSADLAVKKVFLILGVDVDQPSEVKAFQESLRFSEEMRRLASKGATAAIVTIVIFLVGAAALGIKQKVMGGP